MFKYTLILERAFMGDTTIGAQTWKHAIDLRNELEAKGFPVCHIRENF